MNHAVATAPPVAAIELETDPDLIAQYLEDAAHYPGGYAIGLVRPRTIDEVAAAVGAAPHVLPVGARSSLTGGATPAGDLIVSTERLGTIRRTGDGVVVGAGVPLQAVQAALHADGLWLPPVPTYLGATVGGAISTNAAGAATFKYGPMRPWVRAMTVVLASGDVLTLRRGDATASAEGTFVVTTRDGECHVPIPAIRMPDVPKRSAGYHCAGAMDLVDLFIGAEGTLGIVVEAELAVRPRPAGVCWLLAPLGSETQAIALAGELRAQARSTWRSADPAGLDVAAIEHIDRRSLDILREDGVDRRLHVAVPADAEVILLAQIELSAAALARDLWGDLTDARSPTAADTPITRLCRLLDRHGVLDAAEIALPDSPARAAQFVELREAVPAGVNRRVGLARRIDPRISKTAADMIVPYDQFGAMMRDVRARASAAALDIAVWGHISDGNVHPNVLPRSYDELERGRAMLVDMARDVIARGGCPLAEHGVGRNPIKQAMLQMLYGEEGIAAMRRVKLSLDPGWKLASGVLFAPPAALTRSTPPSSDA